MRHLHTGRKLGVAPHHRRALLRSLTLSLIEQETIRTTPARAKELRWYAERVVTWAKDGHLAGRRNIVQLLGSTQTNHPGQNRVRNALDRIYTILVPRFKDRNGGYTQIIRLVDRRPGDNAEMCVMRYLPLLEDKSAKKAPSKGAKPTEPKVEKDKKATASASAKKTAPPKEKREAKAAKAEPQDQPVKAKNQKKEG